MTLKHWGNNTWKKEKLSIPVTVLAKKRRMKILLASAV